jgi:hypothetical protein
MTTKADVGLALVQNYPVASLADSLNSNITNKYITPSNLQYALLQLEQSGSNFANGLLKTNSGIDLLDSNDNSKALTASGLSNIINNNNTAFNAVQSSFSQLIKNNKILAVSVTGTNEIIASINSADLNNSHGIIIFTAVNTNTGNVTFKKDSLFKKVMHWDSSELLPNQITIGKKYALLPFENDYILLNPSDIVDNSYTDNAISNHLNSPNPHSQYLTLDQVTSIYNIGFKGSYFGNAVLSGSTYAARMPSVVVTLGVFCITFDSINPINSSLTLNGVTKPLKDFNGNALPANELVPNEARIVLSTPDSYRLHSVRTQINIQVSTAIDNHVVLPDPHLQYWNTDRGMGFLNTAINLEKQERISSDTVITNNLNQLSTNVGYTGTSFVGQYLINKQ